MFEKDGTKIKFTPDGYEIFDGSTIFQWRINQGQLELINEKVNLSFPYKVDEKGMTLFLNDGSERFYKRLSDSADLTQEERESLILLKANTTPVPTIEK